MRPPPDSLSCSEKAELAILDVARRHTSTTSANSRVLGVLAPRAVCPKAGSGAEGFEGADEADFLIERADGRVPFRRWETPQPKGWKLVGVESLVSQGHKPG